MNKRNGNRETLLLFRLLLGKEKADSFWETAKATSENRFPFILNFISAAEMYISAGEMYIPAAEMYISRREMKFFLGVDHLYQPGEILL